MVEAFDRADMKAMLVNTVLGPAAETVVIAASGLAGYGPNNIIATRRISERLYLVGDTVSEAAPGQRPDGSARRHRRLSSGQSGGADYSGGRGMSRIAVAMSGGVDSSVTAALLKQQGHEVIGITMRLFAPHSSGIGSAVHDAAVVAGHLGIPHHVADFAPDFSELIIADFIDEYRCGHTPNPCVRCNRYIKFGLLLEKSRELGAELLATGHYVRKTVDPDGSCHLRIARAHPQGSVLLPLHADPAAAAAGHLPAG